MTSLDLDMAETLIVLAGDNAWAAARAFGSNAAHAGKPDEAHAWRNVARAVLRRLTGAKADPVELTIKPEILAETPLETAPMAPIPLRAKRQLAMLAHAESDVQSEPNQGGYARAA